MMYWERPKSSMRANLPYLGLTLIAGATLAWFVITQDPFAASATEAAPSTTVPISETTTTSNGATETSEAATTTSSSIPLPDEPLQGLASEVITDQLNQPVFAETAPGSDTIYVLERRGTIRRVDPLTGEIEPFLDIVNRSNADKGIELGLLGLAFHPDFVNNRRFFIYFTDVEHDTAVVEYVVGANGLPEGGSYNRLMEIDRLPNGLRHNAGMMQFGPEGYLYIGSGDNGEFDVNPQDPSILKGVIMRIDVDSDQTPYGTPPDNPWADGSGAPETWAIGLRNPWRFAIDVPENMIYIGDVGQGTWEEVNAVPLEPVGYNFGWPHLEGRACWAPRSGCTTAGMTMPVTAYSHEEGCSVTGGYVYRGTAIPELIGHYFYSDWCTGFIRTFRFENGGIGDITDWTAAGMENPGQVTSFGEDADGELLYTTSEGILARIVPVR
jgi:glucose/arabinose dehydrogenase